MTISRRLSPARGEIPYRDTWQTVLCRKCHQPIERGPEGGWGHVINPKHRHHYPLPERAS